MNSCDEFFACHGIDTAKECDPSTYNESCPSDGQKTNCSPIGGGKYRVRTVTCSEEFTRATKCISVSIGGTTQAACAEAKCSESDGSAAGRCQGDTLIRCFSGAQTSVDCAAQGGKCVEEGTPAIARCELPDDMKCEKSRCEGNVAVQCTTSTAPGQRTNCDDLGENLACRDKLSSGATFFCEYAGSEEKCSTGEAKCDGDDAQVCFYGQWEKVPCSAVGAKCDNSACPPGTSCGVEFIRCKL